MYLVVTSALGNTYNSHPFFTDEEVETQIALKKKKN